MIIQTLCIDVKMDLYQIVCAYQLNLITERACANIHFPWGAILTD